MSLRRNSATNFASRQMDRRVADMRAAQRRYFDERCDELREQMRRDLDEARAEFEAQANELLEELHRLRTWYATVNGELEQIARLRAEAAFHLARRLHDALNADCCERRGSGARVRAGLGAALIRCNERRMSDEGRR